MSGCGAPANKKQVEPKADPPEERVLNTGPGEVSKRNDKGKRLLLWTVKWQMARLTYADKVDFSGSMKNVSGIIFEAGKAASDFTADEARADRGSNTLTLSGHVKVESKNPKSMLSCDQVVWDANQEIVKASGNVNVDALDYMIGPFSELWASPTLDHVGTPDTFPKKKAMGVIKHES